MTLAAGTVHDQASQFSKRRLKRASEHVSKLWFPVNQELVGKIQAGLEEGVYDLDIDFLLEDVKTDYALFMHCLRGLGSTLQQEGIPVAKDGGPLELFKRAGLERIKQVLLDESLVAGPHTIDAMSSEQVLRLQEAVVSASVVEVVAERQNLDPRTGYTVALLRQLGLTLIAWNYPRVYHRTIASLEPGVSLDDALGAALGFSPALLAASLVQDWCIGGDVSAALEVATGSSDADQSLSGIGATLHHMCEVGEALARANDPTHYPDAERDWQIAADAIESFLGTNGLKEVQTKVAENCINYKKNFPELFEGLDRVDPEPRLARRKASALAKNNPYIKHCRPHLRKKLQDLYETLDGSTVSKESVRILVQEIIPFAGYTGGCIYILDPTSHRLMPRVTIDGCSLLEIEPVALLEESDNQSPISTAYSCSSPIMENVLSTDAGLVSYVAGVIGKKKKAGVIYLEMAEVALRNTDSNRLLRFKAIRQALNDCLNL